MLLSVCGDKRYGEDVQENVQTLFFLVVGTLATVNIVNASKITIQACILNSKVKKHKKMIKDARRKKQEEWAKKLKAQDEKKELAR